MIKDVISSGDEISGTVFNRDFYTSSYSNGSLIRDNMIQTGIESRVKIQDIVSNQLPEFVLDESPKAVDFLKQYYISQEYQGGPTDIVENLDQYLKVDNLTPEVVVGSTTLSSNIDTAATTITVPTTKDFQSIWIAEN